mmetsp:Transcript_9154/g.37514  ORF Transcript_9154/g.37514 Transcript_9154/m.37514 type:complete len:206 (-) Transcript_9154:64-681(-)
MNSGRRATSTLPPHRMTPTRLHPASRGQEPQPRAITAASPTAPDGSTATLSCSYTARIAWRISCSVTVTTSSTRSRTTGHVWSPRRACRPSAMVCVLSRFVKSSLAALHACTSATPLAPTGSAATMSVEGWRALVAMAMPEVMPPPEIGTTMASSTLPASSGAGFAADGCLWWGREGPMVVGVACASSCCCISATCSKSSSAMVP